MYRINKDEGDDESLPLQAFRRDAVLEYLNEGRLSTSYVGIRNIPSDTCYDDTKHYQKTIWTQAYSEPL